MIQPSALNFLIVAAFIVLFGFAWRSLAAKWSENKWGQAMAYVY